MLATRTNVQWGCRPVFVLHRAPPAVIWKEYPPDMSQQLSWRRANMRSVLKRLSATRPLCISRWSDHPASLEMQDALSRRTRPDIRLGSARNPLPTMQVDAAHKEPLVLQVRASLEYRSTLADCARDAGISGKSPGVFSVEQCLRTRNGTWTIKLASELMR
jgi:hypothetical protein